jgi:hypothetical protein
VRWSSANKKQAIVDELAKEGVFFEAKHRSSRVNPLLGGVPQAGWVNPRRSLANAECFIDRGKMVWDGWWVAEVEPTPSLRATPPRRGFTRDIGW